jgi:acetolactate decarboxylase
MHYRKFLVLLTCLICFLFPHASHGGEVLYQYSIIGALMAGVYDGQLTAGELKKQGNLGLGTFNALDGEMVVIDGKVYQVTVDGKVIQAPDNAKIPFAAVTFFTPKIIIPLKKAMNFAELTQLIDKALPTKNLMYALKIEGRFSRVKARSVPRQTRPYPPLAQAVEQQKIFVLTDVEGAMVGFRCPSYLKGVNVPGYHFHFLTRDRQAGGHVLDCSLVNLTVQVDPTCRLSLTLPEEPDFFRVNLEKDTHGDPKKLMNAH